MDFLKRIADFISKYRWAVLILLLGVVLMLIPNAKESDTTSVETVAAVEETDISQQLTAILGQIKGVGKVQLLLTVDTGSQTVYRADGEDTVIVTNADRAQSGLVEWVEAPVYRGAVVVCQGADSPSVRLSIVEAVSSVTGLSSDRITVLKMK